MRRRLSTLLVALVLPLGLLACDGGEEDLDPVVDDQEGGATTDTGVGDDLDEETSS